jgi:hypothetical protein
VRALRQERHRRRHPDLRELRPSFGDQQYLDLTTKYEKLQRQLAFQVSKKELDSVNAPGLNVKNIPEIFPQIIGNLDVYSTIAYFVDKGKTKSNHACTTANALHPVRNGKSIQRRIDFDHRNSVDFGDKVESTRHRTSNHFSLEQVAILLVTLVLKGAIIDPQSLPLLKKKCNT